ncbi:MAG: tetratricopeptide repeat protein [Cyanobacteria bacterium]|nr:tetratricopeptide repeat protein [Cyanobacteriota bacterium]
MDAAAAQSASTLQQIARLVQGQRYGEAETLCQQFLQQQPENPEALHWMGAIAYATGNYNRALNFTGEALMRQPDNVAFLNTAGLICKAVGMLEAGLRHYRKARQLQPRATEVLKNFQDLVAWAEYVFEENAQRYVNEGSPVDAARVHLEMGDLWREVDYLANAEHHYRRAIALRPTPLGITAPADPPPPPIPEGTPAHAAPATWRTTLATGRDPDLLSTINHPVFGTLLERQAEIMAHRGNPAGAMALCEEALRLNPQMPEGHKLLGNLRLSQGDAQGAANAYVSAIQLKPDFVEAIANLAGAFFKKQQFNEAIEWYQKALAINPNSAPILWNLGNAFEGAGKVPEAVQAWSQSANIDPHHAGPGGCHKLASILNGLDRKNEGFSWYERAIALDPNYLPSHWDGCEILNFSTNHAAARQWAARFRDVTTGPINILASMMYVKVFCNQGDGKLAREQFDRIEPELLANVENFDLSDTIKLYVNTLFDLPHIRDDVAANTVLVNRIAEHYRRQILQVFEQQRQGNPEVFPTLRDRTYPWPARSRDRPLRLGFMSRHYRRHSVGWCSADIMAELKKITPHLFFYVTGDLTDDDRTPYFTRVAEQFYRPGTPEFPALNHVNLIRRIEADQLDVLIDLDSVTILNHVEVMLHRPAPVCVTWLGYDAPHVCPDNYNLVDWHTHPAGVDRHYVEQLVRLPHSFAAIAGLESRHTSRKLQRQLQRLDEDQVCFLCVATGQKASPEMLAAQVHILKHVPNSILFFKCRVGDMEGIVGLYQEECRRQGVNPHRIRLLPRTAREEEHRTAYLISDVLLDSYPYSGATHNLEALWFNLPIVTRIGEQSFSRLGYSLMRAAGLDNEGCTWSWEEYIDWGVRLGRDRDLRMAYRQKLEAGKNPDRLAPLWNPKQFAADMYRILEDLRSKAEFRGI